MARLVFGMNQSLDGYVDHLWRLCRSPRSSATSSRRDQGAGGAVSTVATMYEVMGYWDDDHPEWRCGGTGLRGGVAEPAEMGRLALVEVGRPQRQCLLRMIWRASIRELKTERDGEIEVAGPNLDAVSLTDLGLIDEYRIYLHPVVLGQGKPYFAGPRPPLRLMAH